MEVESPVRSVVRAVELLLALQRGPLSVGELCERTSQTKARVTRVLEILTEDHLVLQDVTTGEFLLGPGCMGIADAILRGHGGLGVVARETLRRIGRQTSETVAIHVPAGTIRVCVAQEPSPHPVRYITEVGLSKPLYAGATGKVLVAFREEKERRRIIATMRLDPVTDAAMGPAAAFDREISKVRAAGFATTWSEARTPGVAALSAPIFAQDGRVMAAFSVLAPLERTSRADLRRLAPEIISAAGDIADAVALPSRLATR
jgi:DNA-binding IclR family transcriptional regulator